MGVDRGGAGQNLLILIGCLSLFPSRRLFEKHLYYDISTFCIYQGKKPPITFVTVQYNSTLLMFGSAIQVLRPQYNYITDSKLSFFATLFSEQLLCHKD